MLNITLDLDTGLAKLAAATTIISGTQVPVTIGTFRGATPASPGASPAFELGIMTDAAPPVLKAYLNAFATENDHTFTGTLDANDARLVAFMIGKGTVNFGCEVAWTVAGALQAAQFTVSVKPRGIPSDPTSEGGPDYYTEAEVDALLALLTAASAQVALVAATGNLTLSGTQTIDGIAVPDGSIVFAGSQTTAADRKRYTTAAGAWTAIDQPRAVAVQKGTVNGGRVFVLSAANTYSERLSNVNNTSDAAKPISTLTQAALDLKAALASPAFTGVPTAPTAAPGTNTTQLATTAFVIAVRDALLNSAPGALDTLDELAAALGDDANFATTVTNALAGKLVKSANLSDLTDAATARTNLGLGGAALADAGDFDAAGAAAATQLLLENLQAGDYTLVLGDAHKLVTIGHADPKTLTVPPNGDVAFVIGAQIALQRGGAGTVTVAPGAGVTINSAGGLLDLSAQYATAALVKTGTDTWLLAGSLA
jgi:hypothetical protein